MRGKNFNVGHYMQTFQPIFLIPAMLIGTIDFYHFIPISLTLTLAGVTRSAQSKTSWIYFLAHFSTYYKMEYNVVLKQFKLNIPILFLIEMH